MRTAWLFRNVEAVRSRRAPLPLNSARAAPAVAHAGLVIGGFSFERAPAIVAMSCLKATAPPAIGHVRREGRRLNQKVLLVAVLRVLAEGAAGVVRRIFVNVESRTLPLVR